MLIISEPAMFWERMRELNLVDDLATHISAAVEQLRGIYRASDPRTDAFGKCFCFLRSRFRGNS